MKRSRRAFLRAAGLAGTVGLAGCSDDGTNTVVTAPPNNNGGGTATATPANGTGTATATGTATGTETATPTPVPVGENETWGTLQADLANTGAVPLNHSGFVAGERNWSKTLDSPVTRQPAFDADQLYVPTRQTLYVIDRETQSVNWTFESPEQPVVTPVVPGDGFVYILTASGLYQHHAEDGWQAFTFEFTSEFPNLLSAVAPSAPQLVGNSFIFNLVMKKTGGSKTAVSRVVSVSSRGELEWTRDLPDAGGREATTPASGFAPTPAVVGNNLYVPAGWAKQDATLYGLTTGGGTNFRTDYTGKGWGSVTAVRDHLFFADRYADVFQNGGAKVARRTLDPPPNAYACAAGSENVFMSSRTYGGNEGKLYAVNDRGRVEWTFEGEGNMFVPMATANSIYVATASGDLLALDQADGLVRWSQDLGLSGQIEASAPVVSTDEIFLTAAPVSKPARLISISPTR